jgi:hypothetical protein
VTSRHVTSRQLWVTERSTIRAGGGGGRGVQNDHYIGCTIKCVGLEVIAATGMKRTVRWVAQHDNQQFCDVSEQRVRLLLVAVPP